MASFNAVHYRDTSGAEPVRLFLESLDDEVAAVVERQIDRLNLLSDEVPHLHSPTLHRWTANYANYGATMGGSSFASSTVAQTD